MEQLWSIAGRQRGNTSLLEQKSRKGDWHCDETYVVGDAIVDRAALLWNHHLGVVGTFSCDDWAHDECDSRADVATILSSLGQCETDYGFNLAAVRETLSALPMPVHDDARSKIDFIQAITASELETPLAPDPHADLRTWLGEFSGNQRQLLKALREEWKQRLATRDSEEIVRIIRKAIKSPKLRAQRDANSASSRPGNHWLFTSAR